jgi:Zn-dependent M28 family amino/carboxypeptidase
MFENNLNIEHNSEYVDIENSKFFMRTVIKGEVDTFIVLTAHLDHLGTMGKNVFFPGAHDNASGCAMVLNLAKYYSMRKCKPHYGLVFMFFSGEELGLLGSRFYTEHPLFPLSKIKFLINLDLMGSGDEGVQIVNSTIYKKQYNIILHQFSLKNKRNSIKLSSTINNDF